ncbi:MAG: AAA family ATPase [Candidatus Micrarchaeaceae archaeon]
MIKSIELINWKAHEDTKISFGNGVNILIGSMGAGKSSVMDAISFALFGTFPALKSRNITLNSIIRRLPSQKEKAIVRLSFEANGSEYFVEREIEKDGAQKAKILKDGSYLQSQTKKVNEEIEKILGIDYDMFSRVVYSNQNGLEYFLNISPKERKAEIDSLMGIDKFSLARDNLTSIINAIQDLIREDTKIAERLDLEKAKREKEEEEKAVESIKREIEEASKRLEELNARFSSLSRKIEEERKLLKKKRELENRSKLLEGEKARLEKEIKEGSMKVNKSAEELELEIGRHNERLDEISKAKKEIEDALSKSSAELGKAKATKESELYEISKIEEIEKRDPIGMKKRHEEEGRKEEERLNMSRESRSRAEAMKEENERFLEDLRRHLDKCPICEREISTELRERIEKSKESAINELSKKIEKLKNEERDAEKRIEELRKKIKEEEIEIEKLKEKERHMRLFESARSEMEKLEKEVNEMKSKVEAINKEEKEQSESLARSKSDLIIAKRIEECKARIEEIKEEKEEIEKEMGSISVSEDEIEKAQGEAIKINQDIGSMKASLASKEKELKEREKRVGEMEKSIKEIEGIYEKVEKAKKLIEELYKFREAVEETQVELRSKLMEEVNETMKSIWPELYPYGDYSSVEIYTEDNDYILSLRLAENGKLEPLESIASGGERSTACLAMRIAFALVMAPNLKWLILDEPTHNIDRKGLERFVDLINEVLPKIVSQVFIITHDEYLKEAANARIFLLSRNKEANEGTIVEEIDNHHY